MSEWIIDQESKEEVYATIKDDPTLCKKWPSFEKDVTSNPFYHPVSKRIEKLKGIKSYPKGTWRYRKDPLRVVYYPQKEDRIIFPLEAASTADISYKRRSKK